METVEELKLKVKILEDQLEQKENKLLNISKQLGSKENELAERRCVEFILQLDGRGSIDRAEQYFFPTWLVGPTFSVSRSQKWTLALTLELTNFSTDFMKKCPKNITPATIGGIIEELYDKWAKTITHRRKISLPDSDSGWNEIYNSLEITAKIEQLIVRRLLEEIEGNPDTQIEVEDNQKSNDIRKQDGASVTSVRGYVIIDNVDRNASKEKISRFFEHQISIEKFVHLMDSKRTPYLKSNTIGLLVGDISRTPAMISAVPPTLCRPRTWSLLALFRDDEP